MPRKLNKPEEVVAKLRQVDVLVSQGQSVADAVRSKDGSVNRLCMSRSRMPPPMPPGRVKNCPQRPSGNLQHRVGWMEPSSAGAMSLTLAAIIWRIPGKGSFPSMTWRWTVSQVARRSGRSRPTVTVFVTWPAMFAGGPPTGIPIVIRPRLKALVACRAIRGEVQKIAATIQRSLRSEFLAR